MLDFAGFSPEKGGVGCILLEMPPMLLMGLVLRGGTLCVFARSCALLRTFCGAWTIFRMASRLELVLWTTAFIVRFWGRMGGRVGPVFWGWMWFVLLGLEMGRRIGA